MKKSLIIIGLLLVMVTTTAVSFVYWKDGITGDAKNKDIPINIGSGVAIETDVNLSDVAVNSKVLVPAGRVEDENTQTDEITFTVSVTWVSEKTLTGSDLTLFQLNNGTLTVTTTSITLNSTHEMLGVAGHNGTLFNVTYVPVYTINGNGTVDVLVTVRMNEAINREQYDLIAGGSISITLSFVIESTYDLE